MVRRITAPHVSDFSNLDGKDGPGFALTLPGFDPVSFASSLHNAVDHQKQRFNRFPAVHWPIRRRGSTRSAVGTVQFVSSPPFAAAAADSLKAPAEKKDGGASSAGSAAADAADNAVKPTLAQFLRKPIALFSFIPKDAALFFAGAVAGGTAKTVTAPLDRWKLMLQVRGRKGEGGSGGSVGGRGGRDRRGGPGEGGSWGGGGGLCGGWREVEGTIMKLVPSVSGEH
ncbi:unnamed protein product [Closterium sp. NIES-54]